MNCKCFSHTLENCIPRGGSFGALLPCTLWEQGCFPADPQRPLTSAHALGALRVVALHVQSSSRRPAMALKGVKKKYIYIQGINAHWYKWCHMKLLEPQRVTYAHELKGCYFILSSCSCAWLLETCLLCTSSVIHRFCCITLQSL